MEAILKGKTCGLCDGVAEVGPFAGGPIGWYCEYCHQIIRKFLVLSEEHEKLIKKIVKERKRKA